MKTYGLIGKSLSHSFSKKYFTEKFDNQGLIDSEYINIEIETIEEFVEKVKELNPQGLNVTILKYNGINRANCFCNLI